VYYPSGDAGGIASWWLTRTVRPKGDIVWRRGTN
jgi:hypothetical protein